MTSHKQNRSKYIFGSAMQNIMKNKFENFLVVLTIAICFVVPLLSFLLWKNVSIASDKFLPNPEVTVYLQKKLSDSEINNVYKQIRLTIGDKASKLTLISKAQGLADFKNWTGLNKELDILEDNPLPAVVLINLKTQFLQSEKISEIKRQLQELYGIDDINLENDWAQKLDLLSSLSFKLSIAGFVFMLLTLVLLLRNIIKSAIMQARTTIEVKQILGATENFINRIFIAQAMFYGTTGSILALVIVKLVFGYFSAFVLYITDLFAVDFSITGFSNDELALIVVMSNFICWLIAKQVATQQIRAFNDKG